MGRTAQRVPPAFRLFDPSKVVLGFFPGFHEQRSMRLMSPDQAYQTSSQEWEPCVACGSTALLVCASCAHADLLELMQHHPMSIPDSRPWEACLLAQVRITEDQTQMTPAGSGMVLSLSYSHDQRAHQDQIQLVDAVITVIVFAGLVNTLLKPIPGHRTYKHGCGRAWDV